MANETASAATILRNHEPEATNAHGWTPRQSPTSTNPHPRRYRTIIGRTRAARAVALQRAPYSVNLLSPDACRIDLLAAVRPSWRMIRIFAGACLHRDPRRHGDRHGIRNAGLRPQEAHARPATIAATAGPPPPVRPTSRRRAPAGPARAGQDRRSAVAVDPQGTPAQRQRPVRDRHASKEPSKEVVRSVPTGGESRGGVHHPAGQGEPAGLRGRCRSSGRGGAALRGTRQKACSRRSCSRSSPSARKRRREVTGPSARR